MSIEIVATLKCKQCGKKISTRGKPHRSTRRGRTHSYICLPDVFELNTEYLLPESFEIKKGFTYCEGEDGDEVVCSAECVLAAVRALLPKMKMTENP